MEGGAFTDNTLTGDGAFIYGINSDGSTNYSVLNSYAGRNATGMQIPDTVITIQREAYVNVRYDEIIVPGRIKEIPSYCFANNYAKKVTIEEGVESLWDSLFEGENITNIDLPSSVKQVSKSAFADNENLKTINIKRKEGTVLEVPWGATNATINWNGNS